MQIRVELEYGMGPHPMEIHSSRRALPAHDLQEPVHTCTSTLLYIAGLIAYKIYITEYQIK